MARVVYTHDPQSFGDATGFGADAFISKTIGYNLTEYCITMIRAGGVGLERHVVGRLKRLGWSDTPTLPEKGLELDEQTEKTLFDKARQVASQYKADNKDDGGLRELLIRRGWWKVQEFDSSAFVQLKKHERIKLLAEYAGVTAAEIGAMLEITEPQVAEYLSRGNFSEAVSQNVTDALDRLLSILGFTLRLSDYDPELMPYFWQVREYFKESFEKPPWDEVGLADYLKAQGQHGLTEALNWIRRH